MFLKIFWVLQCCQCIYIFAFLCPIPVLQSQNIHQECQVGCHFQAIKQFILELQNSSWHERCLEMVPFLHCESRGNLGHLLMSTLIHQIATIPNNG